jgi:hypothetical protein
MGQLKFLSEIQERGNWYVSTARSSQSSQGPQYHVTFPNAEFPHMLAIHSEDLRSGGSRIKIRKAIEAQLSGIVVFDSIDRGYWYKYPSKHSWDSNGYQVSNTWCRFWFEIETDAVAFKLLFNDLIKPITNEHPDGCHPNSELRRTMDEYGNWVQAEY